MARKQIADNNMTQTNGPLYDAVPHENPELIPNLMPTEAEKMRSAADGEYNDPLSALTNAVPIPPAHIAPEPKRKAKRMVLDAELQAMASINQILADLDAEACYRVLMWMNSRYTPHTKTGGGAV